MCRSLISLSLLYTGVHRGCWRPNLIKEDLREVPSAQGTCTDWTTSLGSTVSSLQYSQLPPTVLCGPLQWLWGSKMLSPSYHSWLPLLGILGSILKEQSMHSAMPKDWNSNRPLSQVCVCGGEDTSSLLSLPLTCTRTHHSLTHWPQWGKARPCMQLTWCFDLSKGNSLVQEQPLRCYEPF